MRASRSSPSRFARPLVAGRPEAVRLSAGTLLAQVALCLLDPAAHVGHVVAVRVHDTALPADLVLALFEPLPQPLDVLGRGAVRCLALVHSGMGNQTCKSQ